MKNTRNRIIFLLISGLLFVTFIQKGYTQAIQKTINSTEAVKLIKDHKINTKLVILDVRTPQEFAEGHIANATNVDVNAPDFIQQLTKFDKSKEYVVYCRSGHRSAKAAGIMKDQSFKTIYNLDGGITSWINDHNPVVK